jgi:hypothetical protein
MIGPASRRHFMRALQAADEADRNLVPGVQYDRALMPLAHALIHMIRGVAFAFLEGEVKIQGEETK